jgi:DNA-binding beta-propeller fold protein YncE
MALLSLGGCRQSGDASTEVEVLGSVGRQPGQFSKPRAVVVTSRDELVVLDRTGRVQVFDLAGNEFLRQWRLPAYENGTPTGISIDNDDTLWIADTHYNRVLHYDIAGTLLSQFGERGENPGQLVFPTDVCPDPDGKTVWVTDYGRRNRVMQFTREGEFVKEWGEELYESADLNRPMAVAVSPDGAEIFVADAGNHRINVYNREGSLTRTISEMGTEPGHLKFPYDLAMNPDGSMYVMEYGNNRVSHFTAAGDFLGCWGTAGSAKGAFAAPWGCAVGPHGDLIVADTNNQRLQILREPTEAFAPTDKALAESDGQKSKRNGG